MPLAAPALSPEYQMASGISSVLDLVLDMPVLMHIFERSQLEKEKQLIVKEGIRQMQKEERTIHASDTDTPLTIHPTIHTTLHHTTPMMTTCPTLILLHRESFLFAYRLHSLTLAHRSCTCPAADHPGPFTAASTRAAARPRLIPSRLKRTSKTSSLARSPLSLCRF